MTPDLPTRMDEPTIDPSGWESFTEPDGTVRLKVIVTRHALRAMSPRQLADLENGTALVAAAFESDDDEPSAGSTHD